MKIKKFRRSILIVLALMMVIAQASFTVFAMQSVLEDDAHIIQPDDEIVIPMATTVVHEHMQHYINGGVCGGCDYAWAYYNIVCNTGEHESKGKYDPPCWCGTFS